MSYILGWVPGKSKCHMVAYGTIMIGHTPVYRLQSVCEGFIFNFLSKVTNHSV